MAQDTSSTKTTKALDDYVLLGRSGLRVSPLCLGTLTFGEQWNLGSNKEESKKVFDLYYERGGNFFDTASNYNYGESERFLGDYVSDKRSNVVIATKYTSNTTAMQKDIRLNPNLGGNHRKSLVENLDESLKRLNMSYVDILYVHAYEFRTPIEEFMRSLDDAVRSGKVLYVAASNFPSWALARANTFAELRGWSSFIGLQTRYNLLDRSLEFDLQPACAELDLELFRGVPSPMVFLPENIQENQLTPEQMKRLDEASKPAEIPFPNSFISNYDRFIRKNIEVPRKFEAISTSCNFGRINL
ncbi:aldo/keto reductase [Rhizophagus irregularis DAOM 181602=DAOM 197198]|uniref:Aldo/keto reductase n=1 Tax=Rhizophagus irregularis (strain DAOM 181602 / DAOM 197198 / MUCL 43194) TaxID=747089 RepID=A0A2P4PZH5_RHIID|nr:aldo/keto reductase [Rhizophagus irregularis DAOM 181602=DAOM 197198]POG70779.1 aldo/keto reductase [Rhizophagus irregularis DAOM 181602=DAOM 197198]|eukprot:XP_025177645.1 aldo/keto reductase [Rhizophagus irregularis DAOM 181602=DAOM 197198]